jgi:uncharacterized protein (DUF885 family)
MATITDVTVLQIADRIWQWRLDHDAYLQLRAGLPVTRIAHGTLQEAEEETAFGRQQLSALDKIGAGRLAYDDQLTYAFLRWEMEQASETVEKWWGTFPVTPYMVYVLTLYGQIVFRPFAFNDSADAERYLALMSDYAAAVHAMAERLLLQAERQWRVPQPALPGVVGTLKAIRAGLPSFFEVAPERLRAVGGAFSSRVSASLHGEIEPAFDRVLRVLDADYSAKAPASVGIGQFPDGEVVYRKLMRQHVTFNMDLETIHQTGLDEVNKLTEAMRQVRSSVGFAGSEAEFQQHIKAVGRLHASSAEQVEERYRYHLKRLEPHIPHLFSRIPKARYDVERLDRALEAGMSYGYYEPPTPAEPRGLYHYNGSGLDTRSQLNAAALIFHELIPGHHFHLARQQENEDLHPLRREGALGMSGYNEGWAEYASELPREIGLYDDPYDWYGRLVHQRFLAQRLVVDTGMNVLGWSLEQGRAYMRETTVESETQIASETLRYSTDLPGQALAYRLGFLKVSGLRAKAQQALGSAFDLRAFHEAVLAPGALPLAVLEPHIDHFIAEAGR